MAELPEMVELFELRLPVAPHPGDGCAELCEDVGVLVRVNAADGACGWGRAYPRQELTGETPESVAADIEQLFWPRLAEVGSLQQLGSTLAELPCAEGERIITAARGAIEMAAITACGLDWFDPVARRCDTWQKLTSGNLDMIPPAGEIIAAETPAAATARLGKLLKRGRTCFRVILTGEDEVDAAIFDELSRMLRKRLGEGRFRLVADVGGKWKYNEVPERAERYAALGCCALRDPCPVRIGVLSHLAYDCPLPIIADVSCVTPDQLDVALGAEGRIWPLISLEKCGGLTVAADMALSCGAGRTPFVLGCDLLQDGLTSIYQRSLMSLTPPPCMLETSLGYDRLADDLLAPRPRCGRGGFVPMENSDATALRLRGENFSKYTRSLIKLDRDTLKAR